MYLNGFNFSVAAVVGFIALAGVAVEIGVIMMMYLNQSWREVLEQSLDQNIKPSKEQLKQSIFDGAGLRVRPVMMTTVATIVGLLPVYLGSGTGSEITSRIAAPMVGGMVSALILILVVLPAVYFLWKSRECDL